MTRGRFLTYLTNYYSCSNISKYIPYASCNDQKTSDKVLLHQGGNRQEEDGGSGKKRYEPVLGLWNCRILHGWCIFLKYNDWHLWLIQEFGEKEGKLDIPTCVLRSRKTKLLKIKRWKAQWYFHLRLSGIADCMWIGII